ncbi:MAG: hypothetical protein ACIAXF_01525 [Phycisphaerales bacterium JB063]
MRIPIALLGLSLSLTACSYTKEQQAEIDWREQYRDHLQTELDRANAEIANARQSRMNEQQRREIEARQARIAEIKKRIAENELAAVEGEHRQSETNYEIRQARLDEQPQLERDRDAARLTQNSAQTRNDEVEAAIQALDDEIEALLRLEAEAAQRAAAQQREQSSE